MLANNLDTYAPTQQLGRYELIAPLGEGGMARVYVAVQRGPVANKLVVVKLLREQFTGDPHFVAMFADESRIAVLLNHPNVIHTYESSSTDSHHYIVMEFLEGKTLAQLLRRVGRENFPLETHLWVLCEILAGLNYAHQLGDFGGAPLNIVHRDVSPSNILITVRGDVKLLDFGIAKVQGSIVETQHGIIKGKLGYASPEQCLGTKADGRADIYSVGVMLWEALAGKRRPLNETALATTRAGLLGIETDIAETLPGVPLELARIVRRALARDPGERFQTAQAFELELRQYLVDHSCSNGGAALQALVTGHFGGELAAIRRAIDDQVGSVRHSIAPESRSTLTGHIPPSLGSEAPHNIGFTAPPRTQSTRLRQLLTAAAFGVAGLLGALLWFTRTSAPTQTGLEAKTASGSAQSAEPISTQQVRAQPLSANSDQGSQPDGAREQPSPPETSGALPKRRPTAPRIDRSEAFAAALKARNTPPSLPVIAPPKAAAVVSAPLPNKASAAAEPGFDLRQVPPNSKVRSLDERDPYAP
ncbi:MAG TPA: protein kinase [Polyangiaceae bacterium]|nr:protein kinase [Polyangiaceae bacterium]